MAIGQNNQGIRRAGRAVFLLLACCFLASTFPLVSNASQLTKRHKIFIVSSYSRDYLWSQDTNKGVCAGLIEFGFLDNKEQVKEFTKNDYVEGSSAIVKKMWMDTKRKNRITEIWAATNRILDEISSFSPDLILLGDDNAANYIGNQFIDTKTPVVFWGINGLPLKYGLLESLDHPGHNITGVYQAGYLKESLEFLKKVSPHIKTFAAISDDSPTGRSKVKALQNLHKSGRLPVTFVDTLVTNSLPEWKSGVLKLQERVDAFFMLNHNSIKQGNGIPVDQLEIGAWYLRNIKKPECAHEKQFAIEGMLCVCDDSGYNQGYAALRLADLILNKGECPCDIPVKAPPRGPFILNRKRAQMLGISIDEQMGAEEYIDTALALEKYPARE